MREPPRVVLDTNVVVSALIFPHGRIAPLRGLWQAGRLVPLIDRPCADELLRVLAYPKFGLDEGDIQGLLEDYLPFAETVSPRPVRLPRCPDPEDRMFLALARVGEASLLVTGDRGLLGMSARLEFEIVTPAQCIEGLG